MKTSFCSIGFAAVTGLFCVAIASAQDVQKKVVYVCSGEKIFIENCNMRDLSDTSTCMVGHPETILANGLMKYTYETRGTLKKLLPTCTQPSAAAIAKAQAFEKKQNDTYEANKKKAEDEVDAIEARAQQAISGNGNKKPQTAEERAIARCITSGRLPASCTGNMLMGAFSQMLTSVLPTDDKAAQAPVAGPVMAGVFQGAGNWRLDFITDGVLVNCSVLSPNQQFYRLDFKGERPTIIIDTTPKNLVLTLKADGTIVGPGPFVINGVIASGYAGGSSTPGHTDTHSVTTTERVNGNAVGQYNGQAGTTVTAAGGGTYDVTKTTQQSTYVGGTSTPGHTTFSPKQVTCPALNLSSKGASTGMETMQTDLLKTMFGGSKGAPTPPGIRMHGIYAAGSGFSVQFFPESAVIGCGPDAARAYPYSVVAEGAKAVVRIHAEDHPLALALRPDGSLDPGGSGAYQVHGRTIIGQNDNDDFTFAPMERTCNVGVLSPSKAIPANGGSAATVTAGGGAASGGAAATLSSAAAPLGNAVLNISSGFPAQAGVANPLAGRPLVLLRDDYDTALKKAGLAIPAGMTGQKYVASICTSRTPDCQKAIAAIQANAASAVRADANGKGSLPGVAPGSYYLMISTTYNKQMLTWGYKVELKPGANTVTLDSSNAAVVQ
jgi:hypothetical protein